MKVIGILLIIICVFCGLFTSGGGIVLAALAWIPAYIAKKKVGISGHGMYMEY